MLSGQRLGTDTIGVARALTPNEDGVDVSHYWGVGMLVRMYNTKEGALTLQIIAETSDVANYQYAHTYGIRLPTNLCWYHLQVPFTAFVDGNGHSLDSQKVSKFDLTVRDGLHSINIGIASLTLLSAPLDDATRTQYAPCSLAVTIIDVEQLSSDAMVVEVGIGYVLAMVLIGGLWLM